MYGRFSPFPDPVRPDGRHPLFVSPLSIGLGVMLVIMEGLWLKTRKPVFHQMARFWTKVFALTFAIGVATGIVMEFEFGTNWATYSRYVGDVFGSALAAEGIFAFFLESGFLAVLLFGWNRVGRPRSFLRHLHGLPGRAFQRHLDCRGQFLDANSGGLPHRGRRDEGARRNHGFLGRWCSIPPRWTGLFHTLCGAWQAGAFLVVSVSAWYLLQRKARRVRAGFAARSG